MGMIEQAQSSIESKEGPERRSGGARRARRRKGEEEERQRAEGRRLAQFLLLSMNFRRGSFTFADVLQYEPTTRWRASYLSRCF